MKNNGYKFKLFNLLILLLVTVLAMTSCYAEVKLAFEPQSTVSFADIEENRQSEITETKPPVNESEIDNETELESIKQSELEQAESIPEFTDEPYFVLNDNQPLFTEDEITTEAYEFFSELDALERCGVTRACVGRELMPTEDRESISHVKPSGWVNVPYDFVDGRYLYNRCHLIGFQLTGENDNERNLITGTRYMNVEGMLPFENMVADYVKETNNHVMYRVTPIFKGDELVVRGVQMEAWSVEDDGEGICYNVYIYNVQPGVEIDYSTGESREAGSPPAEEEPAETKRPAGKKYILNTNSKKFHLPECSGAENMKKENREEFTGSRKTLIGDGYEPCGQCEP